METTITLNFVFYQILEDGTRKYFEIEKEIDGMVDDYDPYTNRVYYSLYNDIDVLEAAKKTYMWEDFTQESLFQVCYTDEEYCEPVAKADIDDEDMMARPTYLESIDLYGIDGEYMFDILPDFKK